MAGSIVMCFLTVPAEARSDALRALEAGDSVDGYPGSVAATAAAFRESGGTQLEDNDLILVTSRSPQAPSAALAEDFWRSVESALFRSGVSAVEHMMAYAVPGDS